MSNERDRDMAPRVLVTLGAAILVGWRIFANNPNGDLIVQAGLLTGLPFGLLLLGEYPPFGTAWFWKAMVPICAIHLAILGALWKITVETAPLKLQFPTRMLYGVIGFVLVLEWWACLRIIAFFSPNIEY